MTTDEGLEGSGEAVGFRAVESARLAIDTLIARLCIGQDGTLIRPLMLAIQKNLQIFGRGGALACGMSAVDIALWDIAGKPANAPVCRLLGGGATDMACYASLVRYSGPSRVGAGLAELRHTTGIPIAAGENVSTPMEFERLLAMQGVNFVQPSPAKTGGISGLCDVFPIVTIHNVPVMPHSFTTARVCLPRSVRPPRRELSIR